MPQEFWASLVGRPHTYLPSRKRKRDGIALTHIVNHAAWHSDTLNEPCMMSPSVSLLRTVPSTTLFSLSSVHQLCTPPRALRTIGGVLLFTISAAFVLSITWSPLTSGTEGTTTLSTGFVTAALTDLKSSGTSETASSTAREISPPEARESTTFLTGLLVCGLKISFLKSGVGGGCGFEAGGGAGAGAVTNGQRIGAAG